MAKVSVVIPVYGVERYIDQLLESIRKQKLEDIEVIFVDDGSPDKCPEILDEFVKEDSRYKVIHQKNGGVSVARNTGLDAATGEYLYIADSDDWLADDALENLWKEAERTNADIVYGDYYFVYSHKTDRNHPFPRPFFTSDPDEIKVIQCAVNNNSKIWNVHCQNFEWISMGGAPWRCLIRRSVVEDNHVRFDPYVRGLGDDILFTLHVYEHVKTVAYIQLPIYHYRMVEMSYSHGYKKNLLEVYDLIFERMEQFLKDNRKDEMHWNAYYFRVWIYFQESMKRFFKNLNNPDDEQGRYKMFVNTISSKPYKTAIKKLPLSFLISKKEIIAVLLLRYGARNLYWNLKK